MEVLKNDSDKNGIVDRENKVLQPQVRWVAGCHSSMRIGGKTMLKLARDVKDGKAKVNDLLNTLSKSLTSERGSSYSAKHHENLHKEGFV